MLPRSFNTTARDDFNLSLVIPLRQVFQNIQEATLPSTLLKIGPWYSFERSQLKPNTVVELSKKLDSETTLRIPPVFGLYKKKCRLFILINYDSATWPEITSITKCSLTEQQSVKTVSENHQMQTMSHCHIKQHYQLLMKFDRVMLWIYMLDGHNMQLDDVGCHRGYAVK